MYGHPRESFIGRSPVFLSAPGKNDPVLISESLHRAFEGTPQIMEFWGQRRTGEIFPMEVRLCRGSYFGKTVVIAIGRDITERKKAELKIKEAEEELNAIINGSPIPKFVIDRDHIILYWNLALEQYSGISAET
jgi:PAS domain S-box-containing protein